MSESLTLNGVAVDTYAFMAPDLTGLMTGPSRRGENITVPGRHGAVVTPRKRFESNDLVLPLWINGCLPDGSIPSGSTEQIELFKRRDELLRLLYADPLRVAFTRPDGNEVAAVCEVSDVLDFTRQRMEPMAQVSVALNVPGAFWSDAATQTQTVTGTTGAVQALSAFAAATAPMQDLTITFVGPISNPTLTHGNRYVTYNGAISAGRQLVISTSNWTVSPGTGAAWTPDIRQISFGPGPEWFALDPTLAPFQVALTHTGGGSATCSISGRRCYLAP